MLQTYKPVIACKTMLGHRIGLAAMVQLVVLQAADDRKQQGRMARPLLAGLPEQFEPIGSFQGA
jgi:hypothetical protein